MLIAKDKSPSTASSESTSALKLNFPNGFIRYLRNGNMLQEVAIVCVIANLGIFYLSLNKKIFDFGRGLIIATFLYVGLVLYISLL